MEFYIATFFKVLLFPLKYYYKLLKRGIMHRTYSVFPEIESSVLYVFELYNSF